MSNTITAIYRTADIAQTVQSEITRLGVPGRHVTVLGGADRHGDVDALHLPGDEAGTYKQALRDGHYVVSAEVEDDQVDQAAQIMRNPEAGVDIDAYETDYRAGDDYAATTAGGDYDATATGAGYDATATGGGRDATATGGETVQLAEERLAVGKRAVERGSAHVRTYVQEIPVEERVRLREERISVDRHPVDRVVTGAEADNLFQERDIEVTTSSEEAVVEKETVVTEEVVVGKEVSEREEVVSDTVRKTEVEVDKDRT